MPRQEQVLSVFVASPDDVSNEREKLEEVIRELNFTWSRELGIRLELIRWETHAYPGMGTDAQDVINQQISDDYDLFVGIMWCRYGTKTGRSGSGTVEEFGRAKARYDVNPDSVKLMMYFKDEAVPPSQLDLDQLAEVNKFRESLGEAGGLYWKFDSFNQFEQLIRLHLTRQVQAWNTYSQKSIQALPNVELAQRSNEISDAGFEEDDFGILDYAEIFEEQFKELKDITERITKSTEELGTKMVERTEEIKILPRDSQGNTNRKDTRRLIARAAADMEQFSSKMDVELPLYDDALNSGMTALTRFITLSADLTTGDDAMQNTQEGLRSITKLRDSFANSGQSMHNLQETIATLPRMTRELNQAKRKAVSVLDRLLGVFHTGGILLQEAEAAMRDLLNQSPVLEDKSHR